MKKKECQYPVQRERLLKAIAYAQTMEKVKLTQAEIADRAGYSREYIAALCGANTRRMTVEAAREIGKALGVDWKYLMGEQDYMNVDDLTQRERSRMVHENIEKLRLMQQYGLWFDSEETPFGIVCCRFSGDDEKYFLTGETVWEIVEEISDYAKSRIDALHKKARNTNRKPYVLLESSVETEQTLLDFLRKKQT